MVRIIDGVTYDDDILKKCTTPVKKVVVEYGTKHISDYAFQNQDILEEIIIPDTVVEIGECAFEYCSSLKKVVIPSSVRIIPASAFGGTEHLEKIEVDNHNLFFKVVDDILYKWDELLLCPAQKTGSVKIPEGTRKVCHAAFSYSCLNEIILPESLEDIGSEAFAISDIEKITIPANVKEIGDIAFRGCPNLRRVEVYASNINCGTGLFDESEVEELFIGKDVSQIDPEFLEVGEDGYSPMRIIEKGNPYLMT